MTTIAWDGKTVAGDGLATADDIICDTDIKKIRVERNNVVYAITGDFSIFSQLIDWIERGHDPVIAPKTGTGWSIIMFGGFGRGECYQFTDTHPYPEEYRAPWAWGSGWRIALGALKAGKDPLGAVRIACSLDIHSGGDIQVVDLKTKQDITREAAE